MRIGQIAIDTSPLRENRDYRRLFTGRFVSMAGNAVATTAGIWQVYLLTHSSLAVGLLTLATGAGMFIGLMVGGMLADRHDRRTVLMLVQAPQAVLAALLMVNSLLAHPALWPLYVLTFCIGVCSGLSSPASTAATPVLVGADKLPAAAALNATASQLGQLGGPAVAGLLIAGPGVATCFAIDAVCFAVFGLAMIGLRPMPPVTRAERPGWRSLSAGFRYVRRSPVVGAMLLVDTNAMIFGMPQSLFPALASTHFHGGPATFGLLTAAPGLGAMIGAATSGWTGKLRRPGIVVIGAGIVWGAAIALFGLVNSLPLALFFLAVAGMGDLISEVLRNALLQVYTPDQLRGRVSSLYLAQVTTAPALGNVEAGAVARLVSPTFSVVTGGVACVVGALLLGAVIPALRHARLSGSDAQPAPVTPQESTA
ncbi:MAG: enterobactin transporter EntS [Actinobacteria bacterium]|nr:enterobactin transporter EntS [Actinomycetota bacterium]